jgi:DNA invertase Pin-like site-specific DNA recombinase
MAASFIGYYRVSTSKQGMKGLGMAAQEAAVQQYLDRVGGTLLGEHREVESGKRDDRPALAEALRHARLTNATLLIAKLDRLSRDAAFLLTLQKEGVRFVAADMPDANNLTVGIMALIAQQEREAISKRTKEALAAAKVRGVKLGGKREGSADIAQHQAQAVAVVRQKADAYAAKLGPVIRDIQAQGMTSLRQIAEELNRRQVATARGGQWAAPAVRNLLARMGAEATAS